MVAGFTSALKAGSLNFKAGIYNPFTKSDLWEINMENLAFDKQDAQDKLFGLEFEHFVGRNLSFTIEGVYYETEHYSFYRDYEYDDGSPIYQNLALSIGGLEAGVKFYPVGRRMRFSPYIGGGAGVYYWQYEQWGDFIDFFDDTVAEDEYAEASAYTVAFNVKAGFVYRLSRGFGISFEGRYIGLKGNLSEFFEGFEKFDMTGWGVTIGANLFFR
jgi:opacity protein-like surface antigen